MSRDRDQRPPGHHDGLPAASTSVGSDAIARGHQAIKFMEGGFGMPRISAVAASAIADQAFGPARMAAESWLRNKPNLELIARSLDPADRFVVRAQHLLDEMRPLEAQLPDLIELIGATDDSPRAKARWLARVGRSRPGVGDESTPPAAAVRSPLRPENIEPDGIGWSEVAGAALGGLSVLGVDATAKTAVDPASREAANMVNKMLASPEYTSGFVIGGAAGVHAAYTDFARGIADIALLVFDLMKAKVAGGDLGVLYALRDKIMDAVGVAEQIPAAIAAFAKRWNDGSNPHAQGVFQGTAVGYIATQLIIVLISEAGLPAGAFPEVVATLRLLANPIDGIVDLAAAGRAARLAHGAKAAVRGERTAAEAIGAERTAARGLEGAARETPPAHVSPQADACFVAGTRVTTPGGFSAIESLAIGMRVVARDAVTGGCAAKGILRVYQHTVPAVLRISAGGAEITCSAPHPFWVNGSGWTQASDLRKGDHMRTVNDESIEVDEIAYVAEPCEVFNISVDDFATYHVSDLAILVHNKPAISNPERSRAVRRGGLHETAEELTARLDKIELSIPPTDSDTAARVKSLRKQVASFESRTSKAPDYPTVDGRDPVSGYDPLGDLEQDEDRLEAVVKALEEVHGPKPYIAENRVPRDSETVLTSGDFMRTNVQVQGRAVYRDVEGRHYHVDNLHKGLGAEIEVYDAQGVHIGTMRPDGTGFDATQKVPGRWVAL